MGGIPEGVCRRVRAGSLPMKPAGGNVVRNFLAATINAGAQRRLPHIIRKHAATLIASFREYGVEAFTFSSGWSSATESAWAFLQNGCTLAGMVEINGKHKAFGSNEYEKRPAFLFRVQ